MKITSNSGPKGKLDYDQSHVSQKSLISRKVWKIPGDVMKTEEIKNPVEPSLDCIFKNIVGNITLTNSQLHTYLLHITQKLGETRSCRSSVGFVSKSVSHSDSQTRNTKTNIIKIAFVFFTFSSYKSLKITTLKIRSLDKGSEKFKKPDNNWWQTLSVGCPGGYSFSDIIYMMKTYYWPPWPWLRITSDTHSAKLSSKTHIVASALTHERKRLDFLSEISNVDYIDMKTMPLQGWSKHGYDEGKTSGVNSALPPCTTSDAALMGKLSLPAPTSRVRGTESLSTITCQPGGLEGCRTKLSAWTHLSTQIEGEGWNFCCGPSRGTSNRCRLLLIHCSHIITPPDALTIRCFGSCLTMRLGRTMHPINPKSHKCCDTCTEGTRLTEESRDLISLCLSWHRKEVLIVHPLSIDRDTDLADLLEKKLIKVGILAKMFWKVSSLEPMAGVIEISITKAGLKVKHTGHWIKVSVQQEMRSKSLQHLALCSTETWIRIDLHCELGQDSSKGPCYLTAKNGRQKVSGPGWLPWLIICTIEIIIEVLLLHKILRLRLYSQYFPTLSNFYTLRLSQRTFLHEKVFHVFFGICHFAAKFKKNYPWSKTNSDYMDLLCTTINLASLRFDHSGVVYNPELSCGGGLLHSLGVTSIWGNAHIALSIHFHTRFSIRNIHKYVCVIYSFLTDDFVFFHKTMFAAHGVPSPGLLSVDLYVSLGVFSGGNGLRKTAVDYISTGPST